jgi:hypothetical protein
MQCDVVAKGPTYQSRQTHTWTLVDGKASQSGAIESRPATWSVSGGGWLKQTSGGQTWVATVAPTSAPLGTLIRASDGQRLFQSGHAQQQAANALAITQLGGDAASATVPPLAISEWPIPIVVSSPKTTTIKGSQTTALTQRLDRMQPSDASGNATCSWYFSSSGEVPSPPTPAPLDAPPFLSSNSVKPSAATAAAATATRQGSPPTSGRAGAGSAASPSSGGSARTAENAKGKARTLEAALQTATLAVHVAPESPAFGPSTADWRVNFVNSGPGAADGANLQFYDDSGSQDAVNTIVSVRCYPTNAVCPSGVQGISQTYATAQVPSWAAGGELTFLIRTALSSGSSTTFGASGPGAAVDATVPVQSHAAQTRADLGVTVSAAIAGNYAQLDNGAATLTVGVINHGPDFADGATLTIRPNHAPTAVTCAPYNGAAGVGCPPAPVLTPAQTQIVLAIPLLSPNRSIEFRVRVPVATGPYSRWPDVGASATVATPAGVFDPQPGNNTNAIGVQVEPAPPPPQQH